MLKAVPFGQAESQLGSLELLSSFKGSKFKVQSSRFKVQGGRIKVFLRVECNISEFSIL